MINLWENTPGVVLETPIITPFIPKEKKSDAAVIIFPGGGYGMRAGHEGAGYAEFLNEQGITAFVVNYRVNPHTFPLELLDARRAIRFVRAHAEEYKIDKNKIAVMGSSAGGHLAAMVSTYTKPIDYEGIDEIDNEEFLPNAQILCYPVICHPQGDGIAHEGSYMNLLGDNYPALAESLDPALNVTENTPPAFIWHTADDSGVNVINSYTYATNLRKNNVSCEMHIFPHGAHGLGLAKDDPHVSQWSGLLVNWFKYIGWLENK